MVSNILDLLQIKIIVECLTNLERNCDFNYTNFCDLQFPSSDTTVMNIYSM